MPFTIRLAALSFTYRLLTIALLFLVIGCSSPANTSPANISHTTPPSSSEWKQLAEDRRFTIRFVSQALWDTRQLVDKKMSRLEIGKLQGDYSELKRLDDSLLQLLMHSITVGNNPAADYSAIHDAMFDWHNKSLNLEVYLKVTSVVPWRGRFGATGQITNNSRLRDLLCQSNIASCIAEESAAGLLPTVMLCIKSCRRSSSLLSSE